MSLYQNHMVDGADAAIDAAERDAEAVDALEKELHPILVAEFIEALRTGDAMATVRAVNYSGGYEITMTVAEAFNSYGDVAHLQHKMFGAVFAGDQTAAYATMLSIAETVAKAYADAVAHDLAGLS